MNEGQYTASTPHPNGPSWAEILFKFGSRVSFGPVDLGKGGVAHWDDPAYDPRAAPRETPAESALRGAAWVGYGPDVFIDVAREQVRTKYPSGLTPTPADTAYARGEAGLRGVIDKAFSVSAQDLAARAGSYHRAHAAREALSARPMRFEYVTGPLPAPQPQPEPRPALPPELRALLRERYPTPPLPKGAATALLSLHLRAKLAGLTIHEAYFRRDNHTANTMHEDWDAPIKRHPRY